MKNIKIKELAGSSDVLRGGDSSIATYLVNNYYGDLFVNNDNRSLHFNVAYSSCVIWATKIGIALNFESATEHNDGASCKLANLKLG